MTRKCAIYSRVSTDGQTTDNQTNQLNKIEKEKGYEVTHYFTDVGISGAKGRAARQGFDNLIKSATRKEFDLILVWSVDRLGRNLKDLVLFVEEVNAIGCELFIYQQAVDTTTPAGKMMFGLCSVFAEFERELLAERVRAGQERAKEQGKKIGRPTNLNDGLVTTIKYMREEQGRGIRAIAKDLKVGVGTIYKVLEAA